MQVLAIKALEVAVQAGAVVIQNEAKRLVPKRTRTLARSITIEPAKVTDTRVEYHIGPQEPYGKWVEFGTGIHAEGGGGRQTPWRFKAGDGSWVTTRGTRPQPYMRPAFDTKYAEAVQEIRDVFKTVLERAQ